MTGPRSPYSRTLSLVMEADGAHCKVCRTRLNMKPLGCAACQAGTTALARKILRLGSAEMPLMAFRRQVLALCSPQQPRLSTGRMCIQCDGSKLSNPADPECSPPCGYCGGTGKEPI